MKFTKMHGLGNDYVYVNCFEEEVPDPSALAVRVSDRHFGIGSDGLILIKPSDCADFEMEMYNVDGTRGEMCGNGIRCVGKYVYDHGMTRKKDLAIMTGGGMRYLQLFTENDQVTHVRVDMGTPILTPDRIPVRSDTQDPVICKEIVAEGRTFYGTCVSMGNPHCVFRIDEDPMKFDLATYGPAMENHEIFPERANIEFISVPDRKHIRMRVWERGSAETLACGTGACASTIACVLNGWTEDAVTVNLRGGDLEIYYDRAADKVYMTGPAVTVFHGEI